MKLLLVQITRNRQGQAARATQTLDVDVLRIGRGTDCKLHLPDPRVALHYASITRSAEGECFIEAAVGGIQINGKFVRAARLGAGQRIRIGPFELVVMATPDEQDLALSVELIETLEEGAVSRFGRRGARLHTRLQATWLSKRAMSWLLAAVILATFLAWPVWHALNSPLPASAQQAAAKARTTTTFAITADASWDPGALASGHHSFGRDCSKCHTTPFVQTQNAQCESCHKAIGWHFARDTEAKKSLHEAVFMQSDSAARCASCHRDHKGPQGLVRQDSPLCTQCHADLKSRHADTALPAIADFTRDHPPFKLSMLVPGKTGSAALVRIAQDDKAALIENSNLKFPHDVHLTKKGAQGIRGPNGRITMECKNCHLPDETGTRFKPTTMKEHCQDCHSLEFEPKASSRQVPHGNVDEAVATVREFYAQAALADTPIDVVVQDGIRRPGERIASGQRQSALAWATQKADKISREMMEERVCFICHQITRVDNAPFAASALSWKIAPIAITQHWLPKSRFPHNRHATHECGSCHKVTQSKLSSEVAIPDINSCRECHGGNASAADKAPGTCQTCHGFHVGGLRSGTPVPIPAPGELPYDPKQKAAQKVVSAR